MHNSHEQGVWTIKKRQSRSLEVASFSFRSRKVVSWFLSPGLWLLIFLPLISGCAWFFDEDKAEMADTMALDLPRIAYKTVIVSNVPEDSIEEVDTHLKAVSLLIKLEPHPPTSLNALYYRIKGDVKHLKRAMAEKGYFDGKVKFIVTEKADPVTVTLTYTLGKRYKISEIAVRTTESDLEPLRLAPSKIAKTVHLIVGEDVDLVRIQEANQRLGKYLRDHGYPFADMAEPEGQIDRDKKQIHVIFRAIPGGHAAFGKTKITGLKDLNQKFVRNRLVWQEGEEFDEQKLENTHRKLMGTGLFASIEVKPDEDAIQSETVPLTVHAIEGPPRTIGAGLKYATTEGIGGQAFWSHHNIFGSGEGLGLMLRASPRLSKAKIDLDIPDIFAPEQHLRNEISATRDQNRAYTSRSVEAAMRLEHPFTDTIKGLIGVTVEAGKVKRNGVEYLNRLVGFPVELQIDASNDLINPTKGGRLTAQVTPYFGKSGQDRRLMISAARGSYYLRLLKGDAIVIAGWAHGGTIAASSIDNIAPNKRFFAGGANSVRAYGYKLLGPLDADRVPLGGRSILEYGLEGRFHVTDTIGFVVFAEAGSVASKAAPDISNQTRLWGIGVGARYYTSIGPIRFDVATPMKRRRSITGKNIDAGYQFYLSVGQAF
jgi:translocation and assembly module TamA